MAMAKTKSTVNVAAILEKRSKGYNNEYNAFLGQLSNPDIQSEILASCLHGLRDCIPLLDKSQEILIGVILKVNWASREQYVVQEYQSFILNLISAHTFYLKAGLKMVVKQFMPKLTSEDRCKETDRVTDEARSKHDAAFIKLHMLLKAISQIVPMTSSLLLSLLGDCFPYWGKETYLQECYCKNLLHITSYMPAQRQSILELVIDRLLKIDVRCPRHEVQEAALCNGEGTSPDDEIFAMEEDVSEFCDPCEQNRTESQTETGNKSSMVHPEADKLDVLMNLLFCYTHDTCHSQGELDWEVTKKFYRECLLVFERIILPTYASCHVQFIMFYLCSLKPAICDGLLDFLWKRVQDPNLQSVYRRAAVAYIASLIARGKFITLSTMKVCLNLMVQWIHSYLDNQSQDCVMADLVHHGPFYSMCQAVFYVFVFRSKEIFEAKKGFKWAESLNLQRIVTSRLNPLRVCLPLIVKTLASITRIHQLAFCDTIIERNNRCLLPSAGSDVAGEGKDMLDSYFPFDPYLLKRSGKYIHPHYRSYQGIVEEESDESSDDEDLYQEAAEKMDSTEMITSASLGKSPLDLMQYGTSPGFKHI